MLFGMYVCSCTCFQKVLMAQWRRTTLGFAFDPEDHMDIQWQEEYSSEDYDSEDLHSEPRSDDSPLESSTEEEEEEGEDKKEAAAAPAAGGPANEGQQETGHLRLVRPPVTCRRRKWHMHMVRPPVKVRKRSPWMRAAATAMT